MTVTANTIEAAARALCRRRYLVSQERTRLSVSDAALEAVVDATWKEFVDDVRVVLNAAYLFDDRDSEEAS